MFWSPRPRRCASTAAAVERDKGVLRFIATAPPVDSSISTLLSLREVRRDDVLFSLLLLREPAAPRPWRLCRRHVGTQPTAMPQVVGLRSPSQKKELAWRRSIAVLEDGAAQPRTLSLFPEDRCEGLLGDASVVRVKLSELRLRRPRQWGACWLASLLWRELQLDQFWSKRLGVSRKGTRWEKSCSCWSP